MFLKVKEIINNSILHWEFGGLSDQNKKERSQLLKMMIIIIIITIAVSLSSINAGFFVFVDLLMLFLFNSK